LRNRGSVEAISTAAREQWELSLTQPIRPFWRRFLLTPLALFGVSARNGIGAGANRRCAGSSVPSSASET